MDTLYDVCIEIQKDGRKMIDKDFIINIFDDIGKDIPELKNYLGYFFEIKQSRTVATLEVVLPLYKLNADLSYPKSVGNRERTQDATTLKSEAETMIMM